MTSWYLGARSSQGAVPNPQASPRIAGTPGSGAGHWMRTPHSSGSEECKRHLSQHFKGILNNKAFLSYQEFILGIYKPHDCFFVQPSYKI